MSKNLSDRNFSYLVTRFFILYDKIYHHLDLIYDNKRTESQKKYDKMRIKKIVNEIIPIRDEINERCDTGLIKTQLFALFDRKPDLVLEFVDEKYDIKVWEEIMRKLIYARIVDNVDYELIYNIHKMHEKYPNWVFERIMGDIL